MFCTYKVSAAAEASSWAEGRGEKVSSPLVQRTRVVVKIIVAAEAKQLSNTTVLCLKDTSKQGHEQARAQASKGTSKHSHI